MAGTLTTRGWTYSKQVATAIVICVVWAISDLYEIRPWYWIIRSILGPWVDTWTSGVKITVETILVVLFGVLVIWVLRPTDMRLEYYQQ